MSESRTGLASQNKSAIRRPSRNSMAVSLRAEVKRDGPQARSAGLSSREAVTSRRRPDANNDEMAPSDWFVGSAGDGQRLDNFLLRHCKGVPRSALYRLMRKRAVRVDGVRAKPDQRLETGQRVSLPGGVRQSDAVSSDPSPQLLRAVSAAVSAETRDYLVVDKPAGLAVHGGSGVPYGVIEALRVIREGLDDSLDLAHRIDRETSGVLVVARNRPALLHFQAALKAPVFTAGAADSGIQKAYLALVLGEWRREAVGDVESWLVTDSSTAVRRQLAFATEEEARAASDAVVGTRPRLARSRFECLERSRFASLVRVTIATGRMHQIRAQATAIGHPLVGDGLYGGAPAREFATRIGLSRMFLHAQSLQFTDRHGEHCVFHAELASDLRKALESLATLRR